MLRKKKAFTLVELLVVIVILAVILLIAAPIIVGNINKSKQNAYDNQVTLLVDGAKKYATQNVKDLLWEEDTETLRQKSIITLQELSDKEFIKLPVNNPLTDEAFDPETTLITVYKDNLGNYEFIFGDSAGLTITNGILEQYILTTAIYDNSSIMTQVTGTYEEENVTNSITYTCKKGIEDINCGVLQSSEKSTGEYTITYRLTHDGKYASSTRKITVVEPQKIIIVLDPINTGVKVDDVNVTIQYPAKTTDRKYSAKNIANQNYTNTFIIKENQTISATCKDEYGLLCEEETVSIDYIKVKQPSITLTNTPDTAVNGYLRTQVANITYDVTNLTTPNRYIKTTRVGTSDIEVTLSCGTGATPTTCTTITSTTTLTANTWYKVSANINVTYGTTATSTATLYALTNDGVNYSASATGTISKIDKTSPTVTIGTTTNTTNSAVVNYTMSDAHSGLNTPTCTYGTTTSYGKTGTASTTKCTMSNLTQGTVYYYKVCVSDKVGNETCKTGSISSSEITKPIIALTNTPDTAVNGYLKTQVATITYNTAGVTNPQNFIKTTRSGISSIGVTLSCGTGSVPTTCTSITSTTTLVANTWYKVSGNLTVTYNVTATTTAGLYVTTYDGTNYGTSYTTTLNKIDKTVPTVTIGTVTPTTINAVVNYTLYDGHSGLNATSCVYGTTTSYGTTGSATTTKCTMSNLNPSTTYYYKICSTDNVGNQTCKTGSTTTLTALSGTPSITASWPTTTSMTLTLGGVSTTYGSVQYQVKVGSTVKCAYSTSTTCTITGLTGGIPYTITVNTRNSTATSVAGPAKSATIYTSKDISVAPTTEYDTQSSCSYSTYNYPASGVYGAVTLSSPTCTSKTVSTSCTVSNSLNSYAPSTCDGKTFTNATTTSDGTAYLSVNCPDRTVSICGGSYSASWYWSGYEGSVYHTCTYGQKLCCGYCAKDAECQNSIFCNGTSNGTYWAVPHTDTFSVTVYRHTGTVSTTVYTASFTGVAKPTQTTY